MDEVKNDNLNTELRKYQNLLTVSGEGIILCGLWDALKAILGLYYGQENIYKLLESVDAEIDRSIAAAVVTVIFAVTALLVFLLHFGAGIGAVKEGKGKKKGNVYLVLTLIIMAFAVLAVAGQISRLPETPQLAVLMDMATAFICIEVFVGAVVSRRLKKRIGKEGQQ